MMMVGSINVFSVAYNVHVHWNLSFEIYFDFILELFGIHLICLTLTLISTFAFVDARHVPDAKAKNNGTCLRQINTFKKEQKKNHYLYLSLIHLSWFIEFDLIELKFRIELTDRTWFRSLTELINRVNSIKFDSFKLISGIWFDWIKV